jgi:Ca2+/Na+ antiporter
VLQLQHYTFLVVGGVVIFMVAEDVIMYYFQPEQIVTVTLSHMVAISCAILPFVALSIKLITSYVHDAKKAHVESLKGAFRLEDRRGGQPGSATDAAIGGVTFSSTVVTKVKIGVEHWQSVAHLGERATSATVRGFIWFFFGILLFVSAAATIISQPRKRGSGAGRADFSLRVFLSC